MLVNGPQSLLLIIINSPMTVDNIRNNTERKERKKTVAPVTKHVEKYSSNEHRLH